MVTIIILLITLLITFLSRFISIKEQVNINMLETESKVSINNRDAFKILIVIANSDIKTIKKFIKDNEYKKAFRLFLMEVFYFDRQIAVIVTILVNTVKMFEKKGYVLVIDNPAEYSKTGVKKPDLKKDRTLPRDWIKGALQMMFNPDYDFSVAK